MNLDNIKQDIGGLSASSGAVLRRMDCGCLAFPDPIKDNEYLVVQSCDSDAYDYEPNEVLGFFIRSFTQHAVGESKLLPAVPTWTAMNCLMSDGITARKLKRTLSNLLMP